MMRTLSILKKVAIYEKNSFTYSDLSQKQLENLKEIYVKKVESMSHQELKQYVLEIISHQINDTIDKEEEMEAWREMSDFLESNLRSLSQKYKQNMVTTKTFLKLALIFKNKD